MQMHNRNGLFDERNRMPQASPPMRLLGIGLVLMGLSLTAPAQTNNSAAVYAAADTNASNVAGLGETNNPATVRRLTLQDCIQMTLQHNLELQIDRYNPQISLFNLNAAYGGYDPSLTISGQHDHSESGSQLLSGGFQIAGSVSDDNSFSSSLSGGSPWGMSYTLSGSTRDSYGQSGLTRFENSSGSASASVTQPLLKNFLIDGTRLTIRIDKNLLKSSELILKQQIMQQITALEQHYNTLIYDRENILVQQKALEFAERLVAENKKRLEVGSLAPLDLASAEAQAAQNRAALIGVKATLATDGRRVKILISEQYPDWAGIALEPVGELAAIPQSLDRQDSWSKGLTQSPALLLAKLSLENAGIQLKYDRNQLLPELDVFGTYGFNGSGREFSGALYDVQQTDRPFYTYGGRITIPLARTAARNTYNSGKVSLQQAVLFAKQSERDILVSIDNDIASVISSYDQVQATRVQRSYAEQALDAEQKKLENGKSTTYTVLQMQRDLTSARGNEILALVTYNNNLSQLSFDEGSTLDRLGIDLKKK